MENTDDYKVLSVYPDYHTISLPNGYVATVPFPMPSPGAVWTKEPEPSHSGGTTRFEFFLSYDGPYFRWLRGDLNESSWRRALSAPVDHFRPLPLPKPRKLLIRNLPIVEG